MHVFIILLGLVVVFCIPVAVIYLAYWFSKKAGYPRAGKILSAILSLLLLIIISTSIFADELFTSSDARMLLAFQNVTLTEPFKILENESMSGIGDYYHTFTLKISTRDKHLLINQIKQAPNFNKDHPDETHFDDQRNYKGPKRIKNYETEAEYVRELFEPQGEGYSPTWQIIKIKKNGNLLLFEDIDN